MKQTRLSLLLLTVAGMSLYSQGQPQNRAPRAANSRADETLEMWNEIGNRLIAMAQDFPEDKYDFKLQKDQRTFAQNLLHVAAADFDLMSSVSGSKIGPDFGHDAHNPSRDVYRTKADVVKLMQQAVADGANLIKQQGDAGLDKTTKYAWGKGWSTIPTLGPSPSSTAPSTSASLWCTIARITWCLRNRGRDNYVSLATISSQAASARTSISARV